MEVCFFDILLDFSVPVVHTAFGLVVVIEGVFDCCLKVCLFMEDRKQLMWLYQSDFRWAGMSAVRVDEVQLTLGD